MKNNQDTGTIPLENPRYPHIRSTWEAIPPITEISQPASAKGEPMP